MRRQSRGAFFLLFAVLLLLIVVIPAVAISMRGMKDDIFPADVAVVLGNKVNSDGVPAPRLKGRLDRALQLYREGLCKEIVVSGGVGASGFDEAVEMRNYLMSQGMPEDRIVVDSNGVNTRATADFMLTLMNERELSSVIVVTQFFHIPRSVMTLKSYGIQKVGSAHSAHFELRDIYSTLREIPALFAYSLGFK